VPSPHDTWPGSISEPRRAWSLGYPPRNLSGRVGFHAAVVGVAHHGTLMAGVGIAVTG